MLVVFILAWIFVLGLIIAGLIIFFKSRKEKEDFNDFSWNRKKDKFDDFSWENERKKEKELFERENRDSINFKNNNLKDYNSNDVKLDDNTDLAEEKFSYKIEKDATKENGTEKVKTEKFSKIKGINPIIKWRKSPWWIMVGVIIALIRFCDGVDSSNNKEKLAKISQKQATSQSVEEMYEEFFDKAEEYEEKGEYEKAEEYYLKAAKYNNDVYALIGQMYYDNGNEEKGIKKLKEAYEKGAYLAAGMLGRIEEEKGNKDKAKEWYMKGVEKEDIYSQNSIGLIYEKEKKWDEAEKLYIKGAEKNDTQAIYQLISLYFQTNRESEIEKWKKILFNSSQRLNFTDAMRDTIMYITGSENDRKYAKILFEAGDMVYEGKYKEAEKLYNEALKYNKEAYYYLGTLYYNYYKNKNKAIEIFRKGHSEGNSDSTYALVLSEYEKNNEAEAENLLKICAEKGKLDCQKDYGMALNKKDKKEEALKWFKKAAEQKDAEAMFHIMFYYYKEDNVEMKEWAKKILTEKGILNLDRETRKLAQEGLES